MYINCILNQLISLGLGNTNFASLDNIDNSLGI